MSVYREKVLSKHNIHPHKGAGLEGVLSYPIPILLHSKSSDFFSVIKQFYILVKVESHPFINIQILNFFIYIIEETLYQNV